MYGERSLSRRIKVYRQRGGAAHRGAAHGRRAARAARRRRGLRLQLGHQRRRRSTSVVGARVGARRGERAGRARRAAAAQGAPATASILCDEHLAAATDEQKIDDGAGRASGPRWTRDPRVKLVEDTVYADGDAEVFLASTTGVRGSTAPTTATCSPTCSPSRTARSRRVCLRRRPRPRGPDPQACGRRGRASAPAACWARDQCPSMKAHGRARPVRGGVVLRRAQLGAHGRRRAEGPLAVRRARGPGGRRRAARPGRRRRASGRSCQRAVRRRGRARAGARRSSPAASCRASSTTPTRRARPAARSTGNGVPRLVLSLPGGAADQPRRRRPRDAGRRHHRRHRTRRPGHRRRRRALGRQPDLGEFSVGISGHPHRERAARDAGARGHPGRRHHRHAHAASWPSATTPAGCPAAASSRRRWSSRACRSAAPEAPLSAATAARDAAAITEGRATVSELGDRLLAASYLEGDFVLRSGRHSRSTSTSTFSRRSQTCCATSPRDWRRSCRPTSRSICSPARSWAPWPSWRPCRWPQASRS